MKSLLATILAAGLATSFAIPAGAATKREMREQQVQQKRSCKAQAAQKHPGIHFIKRNAFVKQCMGQKA